MFCIHTFRKVELSVVEDVEGPVRVWQEEKAVQTDDDQKTHHRPGLLGRCLVSASNPSNSSDSEDSLCRIEHAPLDGFPFPQARGQQPGRPEPVELRFAEEPGVDLTHITVRADINSQDVTVV
ncbi:hypothetical protein VZT92_026513 [Zoarces viviparus]